MIITPSGDKNPAPKKRNKKTMLINTGYLLIFLFGLLLVFNQQIKHLLVERTVNQYGIEHLSREDIKTNEQKEASFDFDAVKQLDFNIVAVATSGVDVGLATIGGIAIPDVDLNLPIFKGISNYAVSVGAGTMSEEQKMGEGNYALASHYMTNPKLLFAPLERMEIGQKIYLTDLEFIYEYRTTYKEYVDASRVDLLDTVPGEDIITLLTCDSTGDKRLVVQGELLGQLRGSDATKEMRAAFNLKKTNQS